LLAALWFPDWTRFCLAVGVTAVYWLSGGADRSSLGIRLTPVQPLHYWLRAAAIIAALMLAVVLVLFGALRLLDWRITAGMITIPRIAPDQAGARLLHMCIVAPLVEESLYRLVLCVPTTASFGSSGAIVLSGALFAVLHFVYRNPGPDNFVAGYVFAWAYLKSGSIVAPIALHALGNLVAFAVQLGAWYYLGPTG
jgi:membrane protease YdiL (CAAX protease family)